MIYLAIETVKDDSMVEFLPKVEPDTRIKDEEKKKQSIIDKTEKQKENMHYSPYTGKLLSVAMIDSETNENVTYILDKSEKDLIKNVLTFIKDKNIVTYCAWEHEFILKRAIKHGLASYHDIASSRKSFKETTNVDIKKLFEFYQNDTSLSSISGCYLGRQIEDFDRTKINTADIDNYDYIDSYARTKVNLIKDLYEAIS